MDFKKVFTEKITKEILLIQEELMFYCNLKIDEKDKIKKVNSLLEKLILKEQILSKWDYITNIKTEDNGTD